MGSAFAELTQQLLHLPPLNVPLLHSALTASDQFTVLLPNGSSAYFPNGSALGTITAGIATKSCLCGDNSRKCKKPNWVGQGNQCYNSWNVNDTSGDPGSLGYCFTYCPRGYDYCDFNYIPTKDYPLSGSSGFELVRPPGVSSVQVKVYSPK